MVSIKINTFTKTLLVSLRFKSKLMAPVFPCPQPGHLSHTNNYEALDKDDVDNTANYVVLQSIEGQYRDLGVSDAQSGHGNPPDKVCASQDKPCTRRAWQSSTSKGIVQAVRQSAASTGCSFSPWSGTSTVKPTISGVGGVETGRNPKTKVRPCSIFFWRYPEMTPFPTLPGRKLARSRGGRLRKGLRDVEVARPSPSRHPQTTRFAPLLF